jgi:hypothetical protein
VRVGTPNTRGTVLWRVGRLFEQFLDNFCVDLNSEIMSVPTVALENNAVACTYVCLVSSSGHLTFIGRRLHDMYQAGCEGRCEPSGGRRARVSKRSGSRPTPLRLPAAGGASPHAKNEFTGNRPKISTGCHSQVLVPKAI